MANAPSEIYRWNWERERESSWLVSSSFFLFSYQHTSMLIKLQDEKWARPFSHWTSDTKISNTFPFFTKQDFIPNKANKVNKKTITKSSTNTPKRQETQTSLPIKTTTTTILFSKWTSYFLELIPAPCRSSIAFLLHILQPVKPFPAHTITSF